MREINGLPAAGEYARTLGVAAGDLGPRRFASSPVVVLIDGDYYVRSIQKVNPDGSLTFFCAIEAGVVLRVAKGVDLIANLEDALAQLSEHIGPPQLVLTCDCILRKLEIVEDGLQGRVDDILRPTTRSASTPTASSSAACTQPDADRDRLRSGAPRTTMAERRPRGAAAPPRPHGSRSRGWKRKSRG